MHKLLKAAAIAATSFIVGASVWAAASNDAQSLLMDIHQTNQMEIHMGMLAQQKGSTAGVRAYGEQLVKDHTDADQQVMALAEKDKMNLPATAERDQKAMTELSDKKGADFDKAFLNQMENGHKEKIQKLQKAQKTLPPSDVRDLIAKLLPTLQEHLAVAQKLQSNG